MLADESLWPEIVRLLSSVEEAHAPLQLMLALTSLKDPEVCDALWALLGIWGIVPRLFVLVNASPALAESALLVLGNLCGAGAYLPIEVRSLSTALAPAGDHKYAPPPQPIAAILKAAQRRANLELGTLESTHDCSGGQAAMVAHRQREMRQACLATASDLLPALSQQYGPQAMLAALRVAQMLLRDGGNAAAAREVVLRSSCEWVDLLPSLDAISVVIVLDVISALVSASNSPLFQKAARASCGLIQAPDAFVSHRALETVQKCSQHACYHSLIASIVLGPSLNILRSTLDLVQTSQRLQTGYAGAGGEAQQAAMSAARQRGQAMSRTALSILRTLVGNEAIARAATQAGFVQTFIAALFNAFPLHPVDANADDKLKASNYGKATRESFSLDADADARLVADGFMDVFCTLASHANLRREILSLGIAKILMRLLEVVFAKDALEGVVPLMSRLPSSPSHGAQDVLSIQSAFGPLSRRAIEALYFLSTHEGDELADALRAPGGVDVCRYLVFAWAYGGEDISCMAVTILMRCGARGAACRRKIRSVPDDGFLATVGASESGAVPWAYLVQEHQVSLLAEMASGASLGRRTAGPAAVLSSETVLFCQSAACACLRAVFGEDEDPYSSTQIRYELSSASIPPLDISLSPVQLAFLELCAEHSLMSSLEALGLRSLDAATLQADLFCWWPDAAFHWTGPAFLDSVLRSLHAFDTLSSTIPTGSALQAVRILSAAVQYGENNRARVLEETLRTRETTSLALQKVMASASPPGRDVLIMCTVVILSLFDFSHGAQEASEKEAEVLSFTCSLILAALSPAVQLARETGRVQEDAGSVPLWTALCLFSRDRRCSGALLPVEGGALSLVLPLLGVISATAVAESGPDEPTLAALQHIASILSGLTANAEARVAESLVSDVSSLAVITRFVSLVQGRADVAEVCLHTAETLVQLLHAWSCSSINLCGCLVQTEAQSFVRLCVQDVTEGCRKKNATPGKDANPEIISFASLEVRLSLLTNLCRCPQGRELIFFLSFEALCALPTFVTAVADHAPACTALSAAFTLYQALAPLLHQSQKGQGLVSLHPSLTPAHCLEVNALCPPTFLACLAVCTRAADLVLVEQSLNVCLLLAGHGDVLPSLRQSTTLDAAAAALQRLLPKVPANSAEGSAGDDGTASQEETTLRSLACDKCLRLVQHCLRAIAVEVGPDGSGSAVSLAGRDLVANTLRVLMGAPRTIDNLPAILRAGEVLQELVLDEACAAEFKELKKNRNRVPIVQGSTLKESPASLLDTVLVINSITQASKMPPSRPGQVRRINV